MQDEIGNGEALSGKRASKKFFMNMPLHTVISICLLMLMQG
ncbi:MAG: hypothetical protein R2778_13250 [Saprospiraceae bacterium]